MELLLRATKVREHVNAMVYSLPGGGKTYFGQTKRVNGRAVKQPREDWCLLPHVTPPIITDEIFDQKLDFLPDVFVRFREGYTGRVDPLETELVKGRPASTPGWHRAEGMFVLAGDPVKAAGEAPPLHLADVAPTVLYLSGLPVPEEMQGEPPIALFRDEFVEDHPLERCEYPGYDEASVEGRGAPAYTDEQEQQVRDHLRELGYMG